VAQTPALVLPPLYAIVDADACAQAGRDPRDAAAAFLEGGAQLLQLRAKQMSSGGFLDLARFTVEAARAANAIVIVNDRADVARMAGAAGVHVGQDDLPPADARRVIGPATVVGLSTHTLAQVEAALREPVDYIAIGPVFATATKQTGYDAVGLEMVTAAASLCAPRGIPVVAIGGITIAAAPAVIAAGAASVAVIGDLLRGDPAAAVRRFRTALGRESRL
jgi:thiamine-phosphate pyrophosphorylase